VLANKYQWEENRVESINNKTRSWWKKKIVLDPEVIIENITDVMFKGILIFGIPYFLFVLFKFLSL